MNQNQIYGQNRFQPRSNHSSIVKDDIIYLIGGESNSFGQKMIYQNTHLLNDVWYSQDGLEWKLMEKNSNFSPRRNHKSIVQNQQIQLLGGDDITHEEHLQFDQENSLMNSSKFEIWRSESGYNWEQVSNLSYLLQNKQDSLGRGIGIKGGFVFKSELQILVSMSNGFQLIRSKDGLNFDQYSSLHLKHSLYNQVILSDDFKMYIIALSNDEHENDASNFNEINECNTKIVQFESYDGLKFEKYLIKSKICEKQFLHNNQSLKGFINDNHIYLIQSNIFKNYQLKIIKNNKNDLIPVNYKLNSKLHLQNQIKNQILFEFQLKDNIINLSFKLALNKILNDYLDKFKNISIKKNVIFKKGQFKYEYIDFVIQMTNVIQVIQSHQEISYNFILQKLFKKQYNIDDQNAYNYAKEYAQKLFLEYKDKDIMIIVMHENNIKIIKTITNFNKAIETNNLSFIHENANGYFKPFDLIKQIFRKINF